MPASVKHMGRGMSEEESSKYPQSYILLCIPVQMEEGLIAAHMHVMADSGADGSGIIADPKDVPPKHWTNVKWYVTDVAIPLNREELQPYSHLMICEWLDSPDPATEPFYVNDVGLRHSFLAFPFNHERINKGHGDWDEVEEAQYFHCEVCASKAINWMASMQDEWNEKADSAGFQGATSKAS